MAIIPTFLVPSSHLSYTYSEVKFISYFWKIYHYNVQWLQSTTFYKRYFLVYTWTTANYCHIFTYLHWMGKNRRSSLEIFWQSILLTIYREHISIQENRIRDFSSIFSTLTSPDTLQRDVTRLLLHSSELLSPVVLVVVMVMVVQVVGPDHQILTTIKWLFLVTIITFFIIDRLLVTQPVWAEGAANCFENCAEFKILKYVFFVN